MNIISGVLLLVLVVFALAYKPHYDLYRTSELFEKFIKDYNRHYKNKLDKANHYNAFVRSLVDINRFNRDSTSAVYGINYLADYTPEELEKTHGLLLEKK